MESWSKGMASAIRKRDWSEQRTVNNLRSTMDANSWIPRTHTNTDASSCRFPLPCSCSVRSSAAVSAAVGTRRRQSGPLPVTSKLASALTAISIALAANLGFNSRLFSDQPQPSSARTAGQGVALNDSNTFPNQQPATDQYGDPLPPGAVARMGSVRWRHGGWAEEIHVSHGGQVIISGHGDLMFWERATGKRLRRLGASGSNFVFSGDDAFFAFDTWDEGAVVSVWDTA